MTPREGVVAWGLFDKYGLTDHYETERDALKRAEAAEKDHPRNGPYTVSALCAHPAATAREEAWKAMVEALTYIASHRGLTLLGDGSYSDGVRDGWIELADAADRALALARSTGGDK